MIDPGELIRKLAKGADSAGPYRDPTAAEWDDAQQAVKAVLADPEDTDGHGPLFEALGLRRTVGVDPATGRRCLLYRADSATDRSWGVVLVDLSVRADVVLEVPHPGFDAFTEVLGIDVFRARPGCVLLVAGAHRQAAGGLADVAHNERSVFHAMATAFARGGLAEVQLHGYADATLPGVDIAVSTGQAAVGVLPKRLASAIRAVGFRVCLAWQGQCGHLVGTTNVQGQAAQGNSTVFVHLESSWTVRGDRRLRGKLVHAIVKTLS